MKSLILKDLYNIGHNAKSMLFILGFFAITMLPTSSVSGYIVVSTMMCSTMIMTTFVFDDSSNWTRYAMVMPVSRRDVVTAKYVVLAIFCMIGSLFGLAVSVIAELFKNKAAFDFEGIVELLLVTLIALELSLATGSMSIPLVFRFGTEKARVLLIVSLLVPSGICLGIYKLLTLSGIAMTEQLLLILVCCSPVIALLWCYVMYQICRSIFEKQDL